MSGAPETTNTLLLWLIIATAITPTLVIVAGIVAAVYVRRAMARVQALTTQIEADIRPLVEEARTTLLHVQHITASVRRRVDEVDRGVTSLQDRTARLTDSVHHALGRVLSILRPIASRRAS